MAACALLLFAALPIRELGAESILWTAPLLLLSAMLIAWAAESAQFFIAQGFALAILAWLQTLPEFAVEAVLAWKQQVPLLLANLTGALRLLTGLGWPLIYAAAAVAHRKRHRRPLRGILLKPEHSIEVVGLLACLLYAAVIWWKSSLSVFDALILTGIYATYLWILQRMPTEKAEGIEELEWVPRSIVLARKPIRVGGIIGLFAVGGGLIYFLAEPFLGSLMAVSTALGVPTFFFVQWIAPIMSEFPEGVSAFKWARTVERAPMALMNLVSSNVNQWTLLAAMLSFVYSLSRGAPSTIPFDDLQRTEILMTLGQSLVGSLFLINMELAWWEATVLFVLFWGTLVRPLHSYVSAAYFIWAAIEMVRMLLGKRKLLAFQMFGQMWRKHVRPVAIR